MDVKTPPDVGGPGEKIGLIMLVDSPHLAKLSGLNDAKITLVHFTNEIH